MPEFRQKLSSTIQKLFFTILLLLPSYTSFPEGFSAGTLVKTPGGYTLIEQLKNGDKVISCDSGGKLICGIVSRIQKQNTSSLLEVAIPSEKIYVVPNHKFFSPSKKEWKEIEDLFDVYTLFNDQKCVSIQSIKPLKNLKNKEVFLLTVHPNHNFFITKHDILVHNFAFTIPIFTWVFGEGIKFISLAALGAVVEHQLIRQGAKEAVKSAGGDTSGFNPAPLPPIDPKDPKKDNGCRNIDDLIKSASVSIKKHVTAVGKAFQKHVIRKGSACKGEITGDAAKNTKQGINRLNEILKDSKATFTTKETKAYGNVLDVKLPNGSGARWTIDEKFFIGFLEG
jgi:hypothetical protein